MRGILKGNFDLNHFEIKKLNAYENENYLIQSYKNKYIFKTYIYSEELLKIIEAESKLLIALQKYKRYPNPISFADGLYTKAFTIDGEKRICRMLSYINGESIGNTEQTEEIYKLLGVFIAELDLQLLSVDNEVIRCRKWEWDIQYMELNKKYIPAIKDVDDRNKVKSVFDQFKENVEPVLPFLRKQIIHNDANDWNVLVKDSRISGIIDFGDLAYSQLINELAVAISYACFDKENPIKWASIIIKAYNSVIPIEEMEIKILYYLVSARLAISICNSANSKAIAPDNDYASGSEQQAVCLLHSWLNIDPVFAENTFRDLLR